MQIAELDLCLAAMAHPARRAMLDRLAGGEARVSEIAADFPVALNTVSKHLRVLEEAGLIRRRIAGRDHVLTLDTGQVAALRDWMDGKARYWAGMLQAMETYLDQKAGRTGDLP